MSATDAEWQAALAVVEALLDLAPEAREAHLAGLDLPEGVRARVLRMLAADGEASPLDAPLHLGDGLRPPEAGTVLGRWRLVAPIGRGGMSTVWRAQSTVEPTTQHAALKVMDAGAVDAAALRRFERELEILARLKHPGVAALLDAGRSEAGLPWFAMGLVDGAPIDVWCGERNPTLAARIDLLMQACEAVAHAHRHLVVHRDIKPGNVLVDAESRVVLVDFGISRLLEETREASTGTYAFTPRFAAPEQRSGGAISTATDVWGLGALAHLLLAGEPPNLPEGAEAVAPPASLPADLRAILRRALQRDPKARYSSVDALADDLRAFLEGRPVRAREGGALYRLGRTLRRHPAAAGLTVALAASLVLGVVASQLQSRRAEAEAERARVAQQAAEAAREQAEREAERAQMMHRFTLGLFEASIPGYAPDELPTTRQLLDRGIERARDPASGSEVLRADMLLAIAEILSARLQFQESQALLDEAKTLAGGPSKAPKALWARALQQQADLHRRQRQDDQTAEALAAGIAWLATNHPTAIERLEMQRELGRLAMYREDLVEAEKQMLDLRKRIAGRGGLGSLPMRLAGDIASLRGMQGRMAEALEAQHAVLAMKLADPTTSSASIATTLFNLGSANESLGNIATARRHYDEVLQRLASIDTPMQQRAATFSAQGRLAHVLGDPEAALAKVRASAEEWAKALGLSGPDEDFFEAYHRGRILADLDQTEEAIASLNTAIQRMRARRDAPPARITEVLVRLASLACRTRDVPRGDSLLAEARQAQAAAPDWALAEASAECALARGEPDAAVAQLEAVTRRGPERSNDPEFDLMRYEVLYAEALAAAGRNSDARREATAVRNRLDALGALPQHVLRARIAAILGDERQGADAQR
ncbi:MAG: hypothetical protein KatS3mg127_0449 [Silanimonas sp.]|nr:MAG: hypothetical protein KatS3mg127_0449 [Silanimonas sp.]